MADCAARAVLLALPMAVAGLASAQVGFARLEKHHALPQVSARYLASGDVDADGDDDLLIGVTLQRNDGTGHFATWITFPPASGGNLVLGDVDRDGDLDVVFPSWNTVTEQLWLNDGALGFRNVSATHMPPNIGNTGALCFADIDRDGDLDLLVGRGYFMSGQDRVYVNDGTGRFRDETATRLPPDTTHTEQVVAGDIDGDGDTDFVTGNWPEGAHLFMNDGQGRFSRRSALGDNVMAIALGDLDNDGDLDVLVGRGPECTLPAHLWENIGSGLFRNVTSGRLPSAATCVTAAAAVDVDGDRDLDLVLGRYNEPTLILKNDGRGVFADATNAALLIERSFAQDLALGDFDGDGTPDLALTHLSLDAAVYLNDGLGAFSSLTQARLPRELDATVAVAVGDVDGDQQRDMVIGVGSGGPGWSPRDRLLRQSAGFFLDVSDLSLLPPDQDGNGPAVLRDFDGDGDAVMCHYTTPVLPQRRHRPPRPRCDRPAGRRAADGDPCRRRCDGDRDLDLVLGADTPLWLYLNDGRGVFTDVTAGRLPQRRVIAILPGDVDADGDVDLFLAPDGLFLNDGRGVFTDASAVRLPTLPFSVSGAALADYDGDGRPDLALVGGVCVPPFNCTAASTVLQNVNGTFVDTGRMRLPPLVLASPAAGDLDDDGDLDVCGVDAVQVVCNLHRHLHAPAVARVGRPYPLEVYAQPGYASGQMFAVGWIGWARAPSPAVTPWGRFWLDPAATVALPGVAFPSQGGRVVHPLTLPSDLALRGVTLFAQAGILHGLDPRTWRLTGFTQDVVH